MASKLQLTFMDYSFEDSPATFEGVDMDAANITAQFGLMDDLRDAVIGISLGTLVKDARTAAVVDTARTRPTSPFAQRENKWLVRYLDTIDPAGNGTKEIPAPDLGELDASGAYLDLAGTEGAAFVAAFQAFQRSRLGNTVTVESVQYVGRNL